MKYPFTIRDVGEGNCEHPGDQSRDNRAQMHYVRAKPIRDNINERRAYTKEKIWDYVFVFFVELFKHAISFLRDQFS